jgi:hypothetical protein
MKLTLLDNQVDLIMKSLQEYIKVSDKKNLIYSTYESIQYQVAKNQVNSASLEQSKNVTQM